MRKLKEVVPQAMQGVVTTVTLTWGEEVFSPIQYQSFRVGPFSLTLTVPEGADAMEVVREGREMLAQMAQMAFDEKSNAFAQRVGNSKSR